MPFRYAAAALRPSCRIVRGQPNKPFEVVEHAFKRDGQRIARQRERAHGLAAKLMQAGKDVLNPSPSATDGAVAGFESDPRLLACLGAPGDAALQMVLFEHVAVDSAVVTTVGQDAAARVARVQHIGQMSGHRRHWRR